MSILVKQHALGKTPEWPAAAPIDLRFTTQPGALEFAFPFNHLPRKRVEDGSDDFAPWRHYGIRH
jgi:hypothetical protein